MSVFADVERLLERVFERTSARIFRTRLAAVQLERRVERAMELARAMEGGQVVVPETIRVRLAPVDLRHAAADSGGVDVLATRLADAALAFARRNRYQVARRPTVSIIADPTLSTGNVQVEALRAPRPVTSAPGAAAPPVHPASAPVHAEPAPDPAPPSATPAAREPASAWVTATPASAAPAPSAAMTPASVRGDGDPTRTMVYRRPAEPAASAHLREIRRDGRERTIEVASGIVELGRGHDAGLVIDDPQVSRRHGRLHARRGTLVYTDLGSTNGSRVNGIRVDEIALASGDRLQVGDTVLVIEHLPG